MRRKLPKKEVFIIWIHDLDMDRAIPYVHQIKSPTHCEVLIVLIALEDIYYTINGKAIVNVSELFLILGTSIIRAT